jgi:uncharacterized membrane protein YcaP (DUF421 family)
MDSVLRGVAVYVFLLVVFRISGKRTLSSATTFDLVLLLIISETTQQAMIGDEDSSMTSAALLILTLVGIDILLSLVKRWIPVIDPIIDGTAVILVKDGELLADRMNRERVDADDILEAARLQMGLDRLEQIKLAVLERGGKISIVPQSPRAGMAT